MISYNATYPVRDCCSNATKNELKKICMVECLSKYPTTYCHTDRDESMIKHELCPTMFITGCLIAVAYDR